jgi:predicted TIM-barrel fold metal-dependent hydrolase
MIIDCHTHIFSDIRATVPARWKRMCAIARTVLDDEEFEKWQINMDGTVEALIKEMDEAGIDKSIMISSPEEKEYAAEAQRKYPDRVIGYVFIELSKPVNETLKLLDTAINEWGLKGVKMIPPCPITDESCRKVMDFINELEVPILVHMGTNPGPVTEGCIPTYLPLLVDRYPKMRIQIAHCAKGYEDLLMEVIAEKPTGKITCDLSAWQDHCEKSPWHFTMQMRYFMDRMPDRIVMGSDWPVATLGKGLSQKEWFDAIRNLKIPEQVLQLGLGLKDFSQEEKDNILGENARRFLGI